MGLSNRIATALGSWAPLARALQLEYSSPWADSSGLTSADLAAMFGWADSHIRVSRGRAMQVATIAAGRHTIAGTGGRLPLFAAKGNTKLPTQPSFIQQFERSVPMATTLTWIFDALIFYPCTWLVVTERDFHGWPLWAEWVPEGKAKKDADGNLIGIGDRLVKPEDVIRIDSPLGAGLLQDAARTIKRSIAIEEAAALAEDNPVATVELHNEGDKLEPKEIEELLDLWQANRRRRGVAYTSKSVKAIDHGISQAQLLIDGRKALSLDVVRHLNLPAWAASTAVEGGNLTYDNRSLRNWELIDLTLGAYITAIAGRLSMPDVTPRGWVVQFDTDQLTTPDQKTRFDAYALGKQFSFIDNAWIAAQEGWADVPDDKYVPSAAPTKESK